MQEGFFTKKEVESKTRPDGKTYSCVSCGLYNYCKSPKMQAFGNFKKGILNIGEAPGEADDLKGIPWQGKAGKLLERSYKALGVDLFDDCLNMNAVNCRSMDDKGKDVPPTNYQIDCCRKIVMKVIEERKPKVIVLFGNSAVYSLIGHRWKKDLGILGKWRGWRIPDQDFKAWLCPTFHPSFVEKEDAIEVNTIWKQDLQGAFAYAGVPKFSNLPVFPEYVEPEITIIEDLSILDTIKKGTISFDYETTGLKPHAAGQRIVCASVAYDLNKCYAFMMPSTRKERMPFIRLLANPDVEKMGHNIKFEETWSTVRLEQPVSNWSWDSMLAAHIMDNRPGITSLKFLAYVLFGVVDYASEISPYLRGVEEGNGNSLNRILELVAKPGGKEKLLRYCGTDSVLEYRLGMYQQSEMILPF